MLSKTDTAQVNPYACPSTTMKCLAFFLEVNIKLLPELNNLLPNSCLENYNVRINPLVVLLSFKCENS